MLILSLGKPCHFNATEKKIGWSMCFMNYEWWIRFAWYFHRNFSRVFAPYQIGSERKEKRIRIGQINWFGSNLSWSILVFFNLSPNITPSWFLQFYRIKYHLFKKKCLMEFNSCLPSLLFNSKKIQFFIFLFDFDRLLTFLYVRCHRVALRSTRHLRTCDGATLTLRTGFRYIDF